MLSKRFYLYTRSGCLDGGKKHLEWYLKTPYATLLYNDSTNASMFHIIYSQKETHKRNRGLFNGELAQQELNEVNSMCGHDWPAVTPWHRLNESRCSTTWINVWFQPLIWLPDVGLEWFKQTLVSNHVYAHKCQLVCLFGYSSAGPGCTKRLWCSCYSRSNSSWSFLRRLQSLKHAKVGYDVK